MSTALLICMSASLKCPKTRWLHYTYRTLSNPMDAVQLSLPCAEMREVCPLCLRPARILGQYSPLWSHGVCRDCSLAEPYPVEVFEPSPKTKDRSGLRIKLDSNYQMRERRVALDNLIR